MKKILLSLMTLVFMCGMDCFAQRVSGKVDGYEYVDLGLPSGVKWATCNIGAKKSEEYGDYFAWGETESKKVCEWSTYKFADGNLLIRYKLGDVYGTKDDLSTLLPEDDAAIVNWGEKWRMPTAEEQQELIDNCQYSWEKLNGVYGAKFTADNGNFVFFPAAGKRSGSEVIFSGEYGYYWSSSLSLVFDNGASYCSMDEDESVTRRESRTYGFPVRAVTNKVSEVEKYVVSFFTKDSVLIEVQNMEKGMSVTPVEAPALEWYEFVGWSDSSFTNVTKDLNVYAQYRETTGQIGGHEYVDLGLSSGTLWATYNIGATKPEEYGDYFAWGEVSSKEVYDWTTYKWAESTSTLSYNSMTKYNAKCRGIKDNISTLQPEDDAATGNWGADWRMPTRSEWLDLLYECAYKVETVNGVRGYRLTGKNGSSIFLPFAGVCQWETLGSSIGSSGYYWSSSLSSNDNVNASYCSITQYFKYDVSTYARDYGCSVRAVVARKEDVASVINVANQPLQVYSENKTIHISNAEANVGVRVFEINGKAVASAVTDGNGNADVTLPKMNTSYVVTVGNMSTKVILK